MDHYMSAVSVVIQYVFHLEISTGNHPCLSGKIFRWKKNTIIYLLGLSMQLVAQHFFFHPEYRHLRFYPGIENLTLPMLSYPGCHVRATYIGYIGTHAHCCQVTSLLC